MTKKRLPRRCIQHAFKSIKYLPHDCIQRAFLRWFNENYTIFKVPIRLARISAKGAKLNFHNFPDCLSIWLANDALRVAVEWQGEPWDVLFDSDLYPCQTPDGFKCTLCEPDEGESAAFFPTREALWLDHLFEPFLKWVNGKLASARWLRISSINDRSCTWAELIQSESKLSEPDRTLILMQQLKRLDERPVYDGGPEGVTNWLIPLKPEISR
jgi:hypothetical protein